MTTLSNAVIQRVVKEMLDLVSSPPEGIRVILNEDDITDIQAVIDGPAGTPYDGGLFQMKLVLSEEFPMAAPKGYFITKIFHPNVAKNGEICLNILKKDWVPTMGIKQVLLTIKCLLIVPNPESALNEEAGRLLLEAYDDYARHAKLMTSIHAMRGKSVASVAGSDAGGGGGGAETPTSTSTSTSTTVAMVDGERSEGVSSSSGGEGGGGEADALTTAMVLTTGGGAGGGFAPSTSENTNTANGAALSASNSGKSEAVGGGATADEDDDDDGVVASKLSGGKKGGAAASKAKKGLKRL